MDARVAVGLKEHAMVLMQGAKAMTAEGELGVHCGLKRPPNRESENGRYGEWGM